MKVLPSVSTWLCSKGIKSEAWLDSEEHVFSDVRLPAGAENTDAVTDKDTSKQFDSLVLKPQTKRIVERGGKTRMVTVEVDRMIAKCEPI